MKRIVVSLVWALGTSVLSLLLLHVLVIAAFIAYNLAQPGNSVGEFRMTPLLILCLFLGFSLPFFLGAGAFCLGLTQKLPGTRA